MKLKKSNTVNHKSVMKMIKNDVNIIRGSDTTREELQASLNEDGTTPVDETPARSKLSSFISLQLLAQWYPEQKIINLQAPCGCGKSTFAMNTVLANQDKALMLVIFRTELIGFMKSMYIAAGVETHEMITEAHLTQEELSVIDSQSTIASYQNLYLKAWAHKLYDIEPTEDLSSEELTAKVIASVKDKVVFIDEADFIITQIIAETAPVYDVVNRVVAETFKSIYEKKIEALKSLYTLIAEHARRLIFMSATTNSRYEEIMTAIGAVNINTRFLEKKYLERNGRALKLDSYNLVAHTEIPYVQKRLNDNVMISDEIMCKLILRNHTRKTLIYSVRAGIINIASVIATGIDLGKRTAVIVDEDRLNQGWSLFKNESGIVMKYDSQLSRNKNFEQNVRKHIEEKILRELGPTELDFFVIKGADEEVAKVFCNSIFETHDIVFVSTNGARAISITNLKGEDVQVITDESSTNTEVVHSWARFRKARVHAFTLQRQDREYHPNKDHNAVMLNQIALTDDPDNAVLRPGTLVDIDRKNASYPNLIALAYERYLDWTIRFPISDNRVACCRHSISCSNSEVEIMHDLSYLKKELTAKDMLPCLKTKRKGKAVGAAVGKAIKDNTSTKNRRRLILSLIEENPKISSKEIREKLSALGEKSPSETLLALLRKEYKQLSGKRK